MATPIPVFPAAVVTDSQLKVANNLIQTTLNVAINASNTMLFVASAAGFRPNSLISIDKEIMAVAAVTATPNPALIIAGGGRGFDGTIAAPHAAGARISMFIDAWHHNAVSQEIQAIEAFIGPNGQNISAGTGAFLVSNVYEFAPQTPGAPLAPGNNVITLAPVPAGVNGYDQDHYLYISGGSGTPEAVLITGGSAVAGAPSGTLIVNCAYPHSGAWTIRTATAGIQEAINSLPGPAGTVIVPAGKSLTYAPITVNNRSGITLQGASQGANIAPQYSSGDVLVFTSSDANLCRFNRVCNLNIGSDNITLNTPNSLVLIRLHGVRFFYADHNFLHDCGTGILIEANDTGNTGTGITANVYITLNYIFGMNPANGIAIQANNYCQDIYVTHNMVSGWFQAQPNAGIAASYLFAGMKIAFNDFFACGNAILITPGPGQIVQALDSVSNFYDSCGSTCVGIFPQGGYVQMCRFTQDWMQGVVTTGNAGITIAGNGSVDDLSFVQCAIGACAGHGIYLGNPEITCLRLTDCTVAGNGRGMAGYGMLIEGGVGYVQVIGGRFGSTATRGTYQDYGIYISAGASDYVQIVNCDVNGNNYQGIVNLATGTHNVIENNPGYNPVGPSPITVGASPFQYVSGPTAETVYIQGATVTSVSAGGYVVASGAPSAGQSIVVPLPVNTTLEVVYAGAAPVMFRHVK